MQDEGAHEEDVAGLAFTEDGGFRGEFRDLFRSQLSVKMGARDDA